MELTRNCAAVIPCFNEAATNRRVVTGVRQHLTKVIVVDDGSRDGTSAEATAAGAEVVRLEKNLGKGAALRAGWRRAAEMGCSWVLMLDGDGQHSADDIPRFLGRGGRGDASLVVGNRMDSAREMPLVRRWVNRWMSRRISNLTRLEIPDSQCGFRLARLQPLLELSLRPNRFEIESAMLVAFATAGLKIEFVPIQTIYGTRRSHIRPVADTWRWLRWRFEQVNYPR